LLIRQVLFLPTDRYTALPSDTESADRLYN